MQTLFSIEGNIGSGKTTFLNYIKEHAKFKWSHVVVFEPVEQWTNMPTIHDKNGEPCKTKGLLQLFYEDQNKYGFVFQMFALQSRIEHTLQIIANNPNKIIICERSPLTDCEVFAKLLFQQNKLTPEEFHVYKQWFSFVMNIISPPTGMIYLRVEPDICAKRIIKRNRQGEENMSIKYLHSLHDKHDEWLLENKDSKVLIINDNNNENMAKLTSFINNLVG